MNVNYSHDCYGSRNRIIITILHNPTQHGKYILHYEKIDAY